METDLLYPCCATGPTLCVTRSLSSSLVIQTQLEQVIGVILRLIVLKFRRASEDLQNDSYNEKKTHPLMLGQKLKSLYIKQINK